LKEAARALAAALSMGVAEAEWKTVAEAEESKTGAGQWLRLSTHSDSRRRLRRHRPSM